MRLFLLYILWRFFFRYMFMRALKRMRRWAPFVPELVIVLGSGLGKLAKSEDLKVVKRVKYQQLGLPASGVKGHAGELIFGELEGRKVLLQCGRYHFYEGCHMNLVTVFMRLYAALGVKAVFLSSATGAVNQSFEPADLMLVTDQINFMGTSPLLGPNFGKDRPRFPDQTQVYNKSLREQVLSAAEFLGQRLRKGVYLAVCGPSYETPAEIAMMARWGAAVVGMSLIPEVMVANHCGLKVVAVAICCNMAAGILPEPLTHDDVLEAAEKASVRFIPLVRHFVRELRI